MHIKVSLLSEFKSHINLSPNDNFSKLYKYNTNNTTYTSIYSVGIFFLPETSACDINKAESILSKFTEK
jgi:hypothetical protein